MGSFTSRIAGICVARPQIAPTRLTGSAGSPTMRKVRSFSFWLSSLASPSSVVCGSLNRVGLAASAM